MMPICVSRVVAPMVSQSDAPFRALCLKYGATCVYSEMLYSSKIVEDEGYLRAYLTNQDHLLTGYATRPLVVQLCGNDPEVLAAACEAVALTGLADAVDLNLGCPQDRAREGLFGSYLLDKKHWPLVFECVSSMSATLKRFKLPLHCKIRIIEGTNSEEQTIEFCRYALLFCTTV
jgi:tRNA-dihydrouridine synthase 1